MPDKIRVMAAENNRDLCEVLQTLIEGEEDLEWVGAAYDGVEAVEKIVKLNPDVVLIDMIMPYLDGMGVLARLNEMNLDKRPRIIILTAFEEETMVRRAVRLGADYYLLKPFDKASLISRIRQLGRGNSAGDQVGWARKSKRMCSPEGGREDVEDQVARVLYRMGVPTYFKGYAYLRDSIAMVVKDIGLLNSVTKSLYPSIAQKHNTTPLIVEAAIRYTIQKTWRHGNPDYIFRVFGQAVNQRGGKPPTNSFFIARVAE
ncbi:MAG TPA: sporulation transcription factor Spo0A, partial [Firmicutes bacterium]|nr:sporulation transcription factor Spo0A [Bacillota bacterium]